MTLDDLNKIYEDASTKRYVEWVNSPEDGNISNDILRRAGFRAVVEALRDEMANGTAWHQINEILGSDAEEAAGGPTRDGGHGVTLSPASTPAASINWKKIAQDMIGLHDLMRRRAYFDAAAEREENQ